MKMKKFKVGDVVIIDSQRAQTIKAKILFISKRSKNVILLGLFKKGTKTLLNPDKLIYASSLAIKEGRWKVIHNEPVSDIQKRLSLRIVAGNVWLEDNYLRPATADDEDTIPEMLVRGDFAVEKIVNKL